MREFSEPEEGLDDDGGFEPLDEEEIGDIQPDDTEDILDIAALINDQDIRS